MTIIAPIVFGMAGAVAVAVLVHTIATRWRDILAVLLGDEA